MMGEVAMWLSRLLAVLPELMTLWEAARGGNPQQEVGAQLDLIRAIKDKQAREEIEGP
jgi:hypothetical protein